MTDHRFTNLRKRLDQLGYRQPLVIEAVPLVEKLFTDLLHTTDSFKKYKSKTSNIDKAVNYADVNETYRSDNARLVKENNKIHLDLLKCKDENEKLQTELKTAARKLEHENQDLRFLNSQYVHKVHTLEKESKLKSEQLEMLQEHNMKAVVETPGGRKKNIPFRRQRMDLESALEPSITSSTISSDTVSQATDPYVADLLGIADKRLEEMTQRLDVEEKEKDNLEKRNKGLRKQVEARDKEIARLNDVLAGGRPVEAVLRDQKQGSGDRVVAHLNIQVDYLQQANRDLEKRLVQSEENLADSDQTIKSLEARNDELCLEIAKMDKLYQNLDKEKRHGDEEVDGQIRDLQREADDNHQNIVDLQSNNYNLKKERDELIEETERLNFQVVSSKEDKRNLGELYERCDKEKRKLQEKNARLTVAERELVMDLERMKLSKGILPKKTQSPDRVENLIRNIEEDRDHYKKECDTLLEIVHNKVFEKQATEQVEAGGVAQILKEERDYYKKEYELLRSKSSALHSPPTSDKVESDKKNETTRLRRERDKLQKLLGTFEKHLTQIQQNVADVTTEKKNVQLLYEQASEEIQQLRRQIARGVPPGQASQKITSILEKAEKERDEAVAECRKARNEINTLRDSIKEAQKSQLLENSRQNAIQQDLNDCISKMEVEKGTLELKLADLENTIATHESKLRAAHDTLTSTKEEVAKKESEVAKLTLLLEQSDGAQNELRKRIQGTLTEIGLLKDEKADLERILGERELSIEELQSETSKLKNTVTILDRERDELHVQVDEKAEHIATLARNLTEQEKENAELKKTLQEMDQDIQAKEADLQSKQKEISSLTKQVRHLESEVEGLGRARETTVKENKRIQDDLAMMTAENQRLHEDLRQSEETVEGLKQQVEEYTLQISRLQDLLSQKDLEKEELVLQYKTLGQRAEELEGDLLQSTDDVAHTQQELQHRQQELVYLQERCTCLEGEIEQHINTEESYENEIASLTKSLTNLETQLRLCMEEKDNIVQDLYAVRELCVKLDQSREESTKIIAMHKTDYEKLEKKLSEQEAETEFIKCQVEQERDTVKSLESVITAAREKEFYEKKLHQEGLQELQRKADEAANIEKERNLKNVENSNLRLQNLSLQEELTTLRKQLTSEKFERERLKQEFRRTTSQANTRVSDPGKDIETSETVPPPEVKDPAAVPISYVRPSNVSFEMEEIESETYSALNVTSSDVEETTEES